MEESSSGFSRRHKVAALSLTASLLAGSALAWHGASAPPPPPRAPDCPPGPPPTTRGYTDPDGCWERRGDVYRTTWSGTSYYYRTPPPMSRYYGGESVSG
jgi:hypothetical protein